VVQTLPQQRRLLAVDSDDVQPTFDDDDAIDALSLRRRSILDDVEGTDADDAIATLPRERLQAHHRARLNDILHGDAPRHLGGRVRACARSV
jgi:hypothetical protein